MLLLLQLQFLSFHISFVHMHMMPKLITLLTDNQIGDAGATQLADALQRNSTLTTLSGMIIIIINIMSFQHRCF